MTDAGHSGESMVFHGALPQPHLVLAVHSQLRSGRRAQRFGGKLIDTVPLQTVRSPPCRSFLLRRTTWAGVRSFDVQRS